MRKSNYLFPALAIGLTAVSCQDYDAGVTDDTFKKKEYAEQFAKDFGNIDPNQDWSMAGRFSAVVNLDHSVEGILSVYTKAPGINGCYLLAKAEVKEGQAEVTFDAIKGTDILYARIQKNGRNIVAGYYDVFNNSIALTNAQTRALQSAKDDNVSYETYVCQDANGKNPWRMQKTAIEALVESGYDSYKKVNENYNIWKNNNEWTLNNIAAENVYKLNNQYREHGAEYTMEQLWTIFGKPVDGKGEGGVFNEKEDHIEKYVETGILSKDASLVVAEDGEVTVELIWRGTDFNDVFGYFFYPSDGSALTAEYLWKTNKYILFGGDNSINQSSDLTQVSHWQDANGGYYEDWANLSGMTAATIANPKSKIRGTKMNLVNFDSNGDPTYEFSAGTKIGFFLYNPRTDNNQMFFSDTKLNYQLNYPLYNTKDNDGARPFAVTFDFKGTTLLGFADGCGDFDINDVVFGVLNVEPANEIPDTDPDPEAITWMVACEDLGGTFDYDFNDLVFGLRKTPNLDVTKSTLDLIPYAAGGTLEAHVLYNGEDMGEIHAMLGGTNTTSIINATAGSSPTPGAAVVLDKNVDSETSINTLAASNITVKVQSDAASNYFISKNSYGESKAPQMILFQAGWDWPAESVDIRNAYPDFADWVADSENVDWYKNLDDSYGYVNCPLAKATSSGDGGSDGDGDGGAGDSDPRTPMVVGQEYSLNSDGNEATSITFNGSGYTWNSDANIVNNPTYKLPEDLSSSATGTLIINVTKAMTSNVDFCGSDHNFSGTLDRTYGTDGNAVSAQKTNLTFAQMQALFSGTCFYIATGSGNTITSVTFKINE